MRPAGPPLYLSPTSRQLLCHDICIQKKHLKFLGVWFFWGSGVMPSTIPIFSGSDSQSLLIAPNLVVKIMIYIEFCIQKSILRIFGVSYFWGAGPS